VKVQRALRTDEFVVIMVRPLPRGFVGPLSLVAVVAGLLYLAASSWHWFRVASPLIAVVALGPPLLVVLVRTWRWWVRQIYVTNQRIVFGNGLRRRQRSSIELAHVISTHVARSWSDRLGRRGAVVLTTREQEWSLDRLRRPEVLRRIIEHQRSAGTWHDLARLERADELAAARESGRISEAEYDERWRRLFGSRPGNSL